MPKNYNLRDIILEVIGEEELSKKKILEEIRIKSKIATSDKTFNESLMGLLRDGKIYIAGYDFNIYDGVKRIQSIRPEGIVFGVSRTDFVEIEIMLKQMESKNPEEVKKASKKIKRIFRKKLDEAQELGLVKVDDGAEVLMNKTMYYLHSKSKDQRHALRNKLAWSLSNSRGSLDLFKDILSYISTFDS
ncbi:MAG TPA: hypothetical protein VK444_01000 [Methanobacteriaceae archaeon]|nr:hypothetical protein [Methanobacteriaceae archaeon]